MIDSTDTAVRNTVLVVDDDPDIREILCRLLDRDGFQVVAQATNGLEAVVAARNHQPDFVILDDVMPELMGGAAARRIRSTAPGVRVVAFSGIVDSKPDWADAYLPKSRITDMAPFLKDMSSS